MIDSHTERPGDGDRRPPGKRKRLVAAASQLLHQQGIMRTTLAEIAQAAGVPPGNVYYYFKTKDEIIAAVVEARVQETLAMTAALERRHRTPKARLKALVAAFAQQGGPLHGMAAPSVLSARNWIRAPRLPILRSPVSCGFRPTGPRASSV
jgi:AcrR family transcriptional regulator